MSKLVIGNNPMFGLVDVNNCYASIEAAFDPSLQKKALIILSNNDGQAIAKNDRAKALDIDYRTPFHLLKPILDKNDVNYRSSNYTLYGDMSRRIMRILSSFCPDMEIYSIDEAFLNFTSFKLTDLDSYSREIRRYILQGLGIPVSIGVAPTKTLTKIANRYIKKHDKKRGVFVMDSEEKRIELLKLTPIGDIWGVGGALINRLNKMGIISAYDLSLIKPDWARRNLTVTGERMIYELNGTSCMPMEYVAKAKDAIGSQKSFGKYVDKYEPMEYALTTYTARCAEKLRRQQSVCGIVQVSVQTNSWNTKQQQYFNDIMCKMPYPTNNTSELIKVAVQGLKKIYRKGFIYKRVGIMLLDIRDQSDGQQNLFVQQDRQKSDRLMKVLDKVNLLNGSNTLRLGTMGFDKSWKMKQDNLSRCYTTRFSDIIVVK